MRKRERERERERVRKEGGWEQCLSSLWLQGGSCQLAYYTAVEQQIQVIACL